MCDMTRAGQVMFSGPTGLFSKALRDAAKKGALSRNSVL